MAPEHRIPQGGSRFYCLAPSAEAARGPQPRLFPTLIFPRRLHSRHSRHSAALGQWRPRRQARLGPCRIWPAILARLIRHRCSHGRASGLFRATARNASQFPPLTILASQGYQRLAWPLPFGRRLNENEKFRLSSRICQRRSARHQSRRPQGAPALGGPSLSLDCDLRPPRIMTRTDLLLAQILESEARRMGSPTKKYQCGLWAGWRRSRLSLSPFTKGESAMQCKPEKWPALRISSPPRISRASWVSFSVSHQKCQVLRRLLV